MNNDRLVCTGCDGEMFFTARPVVRDREWIHAESYATDPQIVMCAGCGLRFRRVRSDAWERLDTRVTMTPLYCGPDV
jgi:hypothetical protein